MPLHLYLLNQLPAARNHLNKRRLYFPHLPDFLPQPGLPLPGFRLPGHSPLKYRPVGPHFLFPGTCSPFPESPQGADRHWILTGPRPLSQSQKPVFLHPAAVRLPDQYWQKCRGLPVLPEASFPGKAELPLHKPHLYLPEVSVSAREAGMLHCSADPVLPVKMQDPCLSVQLLPSDFCFPLPLS